MNIVKLQQTTVLYCLNSHEYLYCASYRIKQRKRLPQPKSQPKKSLIH